MKKWFSTENDKTALYDTSTITIEWAKKYKRFLTEYDNIIQQKLYLSENAKKEIIKLSKKYGAYDNGGEFGNIEGDIIFLDPEYIQQKLVGSIHDPIDDMTAALGRFNLRVLVHGEVTLGVNRKFCIDKIGLYIRDSYDFSGFQFLGFWRESSNYAGKNPFLGERVYNSDFAAYQSEWGYGHDFIVYSDIAVHSLSPKETFNEIMSQE